MAGISHTLRSFGVSACSSTYMSISFAVRFFGVDNFFLFNIMSDSNGC